MANIEPRALGRVVVATWEPGPSVTVDSAPPTMPGDAPVLTALSGGRGIAVQWSAGSDETTPANQLVYEVHAARAPGQSFSVRAVSEPGETSVEVSDLDPNTTYYVKVRVRDRASNVSAATSEASINTGDELTANKPIVSAVSPAAGTPISKTQTISFSVTDTSGSFRRVIVTVRYAATGAEEVIHNGDAFRGAYAGASSREIIAGGFRYHVQRTGGWPSAPEFRAYATDLEGFETP